MVKVIEIFFVTDSKMIHNFLDIQLITLTMPYLLLDGVLKMALITGQSRILGVKDMVIMDISKLQGVLVESINIVQLLNVLPMVLLILFHLNQLYHNCQLVMLVEVGMILLVDLIGSHGPLMVI